MVTKLALHPLGRLISTGAFQILGGCRSLGVPRDPGCLRAPTLSRSHEAAFGMGGMGHALTGSEYSEDEPRDGAGTAVAWRASYAHCLNKGAKRCPHPSSRFGLTMRLRERLDSPGRGLGTGGEEPEWFKRLGALPAGEHLSGGRIGGTRWCTSGVEKDRASRA